MYKCVNDMKKILNICVCILLLVACKPKSYMGDLPELTPNTDTQAVLALNPRAVVDTEDPNLVHLLMDEKDGWVGMWQVGNKRYTQFCVDRRFEFAGEYTVKASAYNKNGVAPLSMSSLPSRPWTNRSATTRTTVH